MYVGCWCYSAPSFNPLTNWQNIGGALVDMHLNCLNWFHFLILVGVSLFISIGYMIFMSLFLDILRM